MKKVFFMVWVVLLVFTGNVLAQDDGININLESSVFTAVLDDDITKADLLKGVTVRDNNGVALDLIDQITFRFDGETLLSADEMAEYMNNKVAQNNYNNVGKVYFEYDMCLSNGNFTTVRHVSFKFTAKNVDLSYSTQIENIGWQDAVSNGKLSGTEGLGLRLEGIKITTNNPNLTLNYETHIQNIGWESETGRGLKTNGEMSGTEGLGLRLEGIRIYLTGSDADKYDIYYRVHAQNFGWLGWASNGSDAGSSGYGYRLEGIEIIIQQKGTVVPGVTYNTFADKSECIYYENKLLDRINAERLKTGVQPLTLTSELHQASNIRAWELSKYYSNYRYGTLYSFSTVLDELGITYGTAGQVYSCDYRQTMDEAIDNLLLKEESTRQRLLSGEYNKVGISVFWTPNGFATRYLEVILTD